MKAAKLYSMLIDLKSQGYKNFQIILTKETILDLIKQDQIDGLYTIDVDKIDYSDIYFYNYRVFLGKQNRIQIITGEVIL